MRTILLGLIFFLATALLLCISSSVVASEATEGTDGDPRIENSFLLGMEYLRNGNPSLAAKHFLLILAEDPSLVRVRLELARAYFLNKQWERSRSEFFRVLSSDLPEPVRIRVLDYIRAIDARRGFDWDLSIGVSSVGDTRSYDTDQIYLDFGGAHLPFTLQREKSKELGLRLTGGANFRKPIKNSFDTLETVAFAAVSFDLKEARTSRYDDYQLLSRVGLRLLSPRTTVSVAPVISTRILAGEIFENRNAWEVAFERRGLVGGALFGFLSVADLHNKKSEALDGYETVAELGFRRSVSGRNVVGVSLLLEDKNVDNSFENYIRRGIRLFGSFNARYGLTISPSIYFYEKSYRERNPLLTGDPDETTIGTSIRVEKNDVFFANGFSPFVEFEYSQTKSEIDAFSYSENKFNAGVERRF
ncbi:tetratricopeptide repeat protein [Ruegeria profundi]|nr:surface lipoprotein assembly modifier [Ruegeria profundi]